MSARNRGNEDISDEEMEVENADPDSDEENGIRIDEDIYIPPPPIKLNQIDNQGPRLIITQIVNINFKSYAGEVVIGPFNECFSAIVGPNGSGKSNVIDSMLFVFGYRASKIRSKKISVLIHNSTEHPNVDSCEVAVHFKKIVDKDEGGFDTIPGSEFVISRTAFKDNTSHFKLNGRKVQFKEIAKILRGEGIDLDHNRFLILQGEVEQIAMMKPKAQTEHDVGMLEFLEDIIGTVRYKEPLQKAFEKIEYLSERVSERLNRLRFVEKERDELKEPMQEALDYLKLENIITKLRNKLYYCQRHETKEILKSKTEKHADIEADTNKLKEEMTVVRQEKEKINAEIKEKSKKWQSIEQKKDAASVKFDELRKRDEALHAELVATNKRRKENITSVKTEQTKLEDFKKVPEKNAHDIEECQTLIERQSAARVKEEEKLENLMKGLREKTGPLLEERTKFETKLIDFRKNVDEAKAAFDIAESELQLYTSVEKSEKEKLEVLQQTLKQTTETLKDRSEKLSSFESKIPATKKSLEQAKKRLDEINSKETEYTNKLRGKRAVYEEQKSSMNASKSRNRVLNALMEQKAQGNFPGIFGRLGDLGAIDPKYDIAVSTACGPLDHIVVDNPDTAEACIQFLRQNDIGRASFIALDKQERLIQYCHQKITTPENVPRLFDLIKVQDERVLPAFYYGLQNTLVAKDLDQATRIAYGAKRYRVVTLKGELIETSGTMSGGGAVLRGRMGQKVRNEASPQDLEKLQQELDEIFEMCNQMKREKPPLIDQIETLTAGLNEMMVNKDKFGIEVEILQKQAPSLKSQLKNQEAKAAKTVCDPKKTAALTKAVEVASIKLEEAQTQSKNVEDEVKRINQKIDEMTKNPVKEQQNIIATIVKSIDKAKSEICRLEVAVKTAERNAQKTEQRIKDLESNVKTAEERIKEIQKEKSEVEEKAKEVLAELESLTESLVERDENAGALKEQLDALQTRETKMKALKIDLDQKLSDSKKLLSELSHKIDDYTRRIRSLKLNKIVDEPPEELPELSDEEIEALDLRTIDANLKAAKERLPEQVPNMDIIKDYLERDQVYLKRSAEVQEANDERNKMRDLYEIARKRRMEEFFVGFNEITSKLKEMYQMITLGGAAELELVDSLDPFSEGIVFSVRPPKKSWKNISNLSGGEKTLSSLALVFALHHYKPTPLYFMDEIDAALDFKNVSIVGTYIKERTKNAQFIVISLRSEMFELADTLVGIYKIHNGTESITLNMKAVVQENTYIGKLETERIKRMPLAKKSQSQMSTNSQPFCGSQPVNHNNDMADFRMISSLPGPSKSKTPEKLSPSSEDSDEPTVNENDQSVINNSVDLNETRRSRRLAKQDEEDEKEVESKAKKPRSEKKKLETPKPTRSSARKNSSLSTSSVNSSITSSGKKNSVNDVETPSTRASKRRKIQK